MTREQALAHVIDIASRWGENAEEGLPTRISEEMLENDALFQSVLADIGDDEYERELASEIRDLWRAIRILQAVEPAGGP